LVLSILYSFPTRRSSDLFSRLCVGRFSPVRQLPERCFNCYREGQAGVETGALWIFRREPLTMRLISPNFLRFVNRCRWINERARSEEHTSELQSLRHLVC